MRLSVEYHFLSEFQQAAVDFAARLDSALPLKISKDAATGTFGFGPIFDPDVLVKNQNKYIDNPVELRKAEAVYAAYLSRNFMGTPLAGEAEEYLQSQRKR